MEIKLVKGQIVITPVAPPAPTLEELLTGVNKNNLHQALDTGPAMGKEVW